VYRQESPAYRSQLEQSGEVGRPRYQVTSRQIEMLRETGMSWKRVAASLGISVSTLYRRREELNIANGFSDIEDASLDEHIRDILSMTPNAGQTYVLGNSRESVEAFTSSEDV